MRMRLPWLIPPSAQPIAVVFGLMAVDKAVFQLGSPFGPVGQVDGELSMVLVQGASQFAVRLFLG